MNSNATAVLDALASRHAEFARLRKHWDQISAERQLRDILEAVASTLSADGCTWYVLQGSELIFDTVLSCSLSQGSGYQRIRADFPSIRMRRIDGRIDNSSLAVRAASEEATIHIADVASDLGEQASRTMGFDRVMGYRTHSILTVPVIPKGEDVRGVLQLINATNAQGQHLPFSHPGIELAEQTAELLACL